MRKLLKVALRNLSRNKRRSIITLTALVVGVTLVLTAKGFANGFVDMSVHDVVEGSTGALQVHRAGYLDNLEGAPLKLSMPHNADLIAKIKSVRGVKAVTGRIQFDGLINNGLSQTMFAGRGLDLATEYLTTPASSSRIADGGRALQDGDYRTALVGEELARSFNAMTPQERKNAAQPAAGAAPPTSMLTLNCTSPKGRANSLSVQLVGKIGAGNMFEAKRVVTVPLKLAQELLNMKGQVTEYAVAIDDLQQLDRVVKELQDALGSEYDVQPWGDLQPVTRSQINRMSVVFGVISVVFAIIVLTGIVNTMLMSVFERVREIGTMLALGTLQSQIRTLFLYEAGLIGGLGAAMGSLVAEGFTLWMASTGVPLPGTTARIHPSLPLSFVLGAIALSVATTVVAALYPAWKASRLNPVDALRSV